MWGRSTKKASRPVAVVRRGALAFALLGLLAGLPAGCDPPVEAAFASPEATLRTLLRSHRLDGLTAAQIRERLERHARLRVADPALFRACFVRFGADAEDHGLAGFVVGAVGAHRDRWRTAVAGASATVSAGPHTRVVLVRRDDRTWRIDLHRSVPPAVQRQMAELGRRVRQRNLREGIPADF